MSVPTMADIRDILLDHAANAARDEDGNLTPEAQAELQQLAEWCADPKNLATLAEPAA